MKSAAKIFLCLFIFSQSLYGQLPHGATAPNFSVTDLNGGNFNLYGHTGAGKGVIIDFFATWCGPCWSFHQSGILTSVVNNLSHVASVVGLEADSRTNDACMYGPSGCSYSSIGNWTNVPYQQANLTASNGGGVASSYSLAYYPTVYVISHDNRAYEIKSKSYAAFRSWLEESFFLDANPVITHSRCGDDGSIDLNRVKGYGSIRYDWSNGAKTENLTNIGAGTYTVTVEDQNGYDKVFGPFVVQGPTDPLALDIIDQKDVDCFGGNDGRATALASGGNFGYSYRWSDGQTSPTAQNLRAGPSTVTVTDSKGCMETYTHEVQQPQPLDLSTNIIHEECGQENGEIYVNVKGGIFPYTYDIGLGPQSSNKFSNLKAGTYNITVRDFNDCILRYTTVLRSLDGPSADAGSDQEMDCSSAEITLYGGGSSGSRISYKWTTTDGHISGPDDELTTRIDEPGTYVLKVRDDNTECETYDTVVIEDLRIYPEIQKHLTDKLTCDQTSVWARVDKELKVDYIWTTSDGDILTNPDSSEIEVSASAWYYLEARHQESACITMDSVWIEEDVLKPSFTLSDSLLGQPCPEVEVSFELTDLDSLRNFSIVWSTDDGRIVGSDSSEQVVMDEVGRYYLEVQDIQNGCITEDSVNVLEDWNIAEAGFVSQKNKLEVSFSDRSTGDHLSYAWDFGDGQTSVEKDPVHVFENEGTFEVCLTVTNECGGDETCKELEVSENRGPFKIADSYITDVDCHGAKTGEIELIVEGGYPPYTVTWDHGGSELHIKDLKAGLYEVALEDNQGQTINEQFEIVEPSELQAVSANINHDNGTSIGSIELTIIGGVAPYSYEWSNGSTDNPVTSLEPGVYTCEVRDDHNCVWQSESYEVKLNTSSVDFDPSLSVKIFPNPGQNRVCLEMEGDLIERVDWIHISGKQQKVVIGPQFCLSTEGMPTGLYLVKVWGAQGTFTSLPWMKSE